MSLRDWWRKITGSSEPPPETSQTPIHDPVTQAPIPSDQEPAAERDLSAEERRTLEDEEIL